jgi:hypothetical protein
MPSPSTIQILINDTIDVTRYTLFAQTSFELAGGGVPGQARVVLKDPDRELAFTTGDEIALVVDDIRLWGGIIMSKAQAHFFPVVDTTDLEAVTSLQWTLTAVDYNIWMDKRVIRNPLAYNSQIMIGPGPLGAVLSEAIAKYMDIPPGLDYTSMVDDVKQDGRVAVYASVENGPAPLLQQGKPWREQLDLMTRLGGFEWRIDAHKRLHFHAYKDLVPGWGFVDRHPNGVTSIGFREGTVREDGMQMVTDALVWGGSQYRLDPADDVIVFARYPDPPPNTEYIEVTAPDPVTGEDRVYRDSLDYDDEVLAIERLAQYGRWQRAEIRIGEPFFHSDVAVRVRAHHIVAGVGGSNEVSGLDTGLNRPVWQAQLTWFAHDVPGKQHIAPGDIVSMVFYALGDDVTPLPLLLPLRTVRISFPTLPPKLPSEDPLTYVRFDGEFGISYSDSRFLWRFLMNRKGPGFESAVATVSQESSTTVSGALGGFHPLESPDGSRVQFTLPFSYLLGSTKVYLNGLLQRSRLEYLESSPSQGKITFAQAPFSDDTIWVTCRTGSS